jgi:hypothetical protein
MQAPLQRVVAEGRVSKKRLFAPVLTPWRKDHTALRAQYEPGRCEVVAFPQACARRCMHATRPGPPAGRLCRAWRRPLRRGLLDEARDPESYRRHAPPGARRRAGL